MPLCHRALALLTLVLLPCLAHTQALPQPQPADLHLPLDRDTLVLSPDPAHPLHPHLEGNALFPAGVLGQALRLDGYTTSLTLPAAEVPTPSPDGFTIESWLALDTYPWNWAPIADQQKFHGAGFFFGVDAFGHLGFQVALNGQWHTLTSPAPLPLKRWSHVAATLRTVDSQTTLTLTVNGSTVATRTSPGAFTPSTNGLLIGRTREPLLPFPEAEVKPSQPIAFSLDGLLDELILHPHPLTPEALAAITLHAPAGDVLPTPRMPSGPSGPGPFGAFYATLHFEDTWDRLRQLGPLSDVVVRFPQTNARLVFWQGLNFVPAWVSPDDKWSTDEFLEVWDHGCPDSGDCEPMSDKQGRFSHVEILESSPVRAVVHWRYALIEVVGNKAAWADPRSGFSDWADEYWTVYPDGVAIRKQVLHSTHPGNVHEWQETIILHQPGFRPEDDLRPDAVTLGNLAGTTRTYTWRPNPASSFLNPLGPADTTPPPNTNMQLVNTRSTLKPFAIVPPAGASSDFYNNEKSFFLFECWNHWPVAQIASSDRACVTTDRPSHTSVSHLFWPPLSQTDVSATKILMSGLTAQPLQNLVPLANSWLSPAPLTVERGSVSSQGYDSTDRAYHLTATSPEPTPTTLTLAASPASPLSNVALVLHNWGPHPPTLTLNGRRTPWDDHHTVAVLPQLESTDLLVWLEVNSTSPLHVTLTPHR